MRCMHCGARWVRECNLIHFYECDSTYCESFKNQWNRSKLCMQLEIDRLNAHIKQIEKVVDSMVVFEPMTTDLKKAQAKLEQ